MTFLGATSHFPTVYYNLTVLSKASSSHTMHIWCGSLYRRNSESILYLTKAHLILLVGGEYSGVGEIQRYLCRLTHVKVTSHLQEESQVSPPEGVTLPLVSCRQALIPRCQPLQCPSPSRRRFHLSTGSPAATKQKKKVQLLLL